MTTPNLGSKRQCPKCDAKFYDFGKADPIACPKCGKTWKEAAPKPGKAIKAKKEPVKAAPKRIADEIDDIALPGMPDDEDDGTEALEPVEDEEVELTSLEEVEEHEEEEESDPNSDDAEDEMFTSMGGEKLVDDLEDHIEKEEDEDEEEEPTEEDTDDEDDEDDTPRKKK